MFDSLFRLKRLPLLFLLLAALLGAGGGARRRCAGADRLAAARLSRGRLSAARSPDGRVISPSEYAEMREFSASVSRAHRRACRPSRERAALLAEARGLEAAIAAQGRARRGRAARPRPRRRGCSPLIRSRSRRSSARPGPRRPALRRALRLLPRRDRPWPTPPTARRARPASGRLRRPRPRPPAQPVRPLPGDRPGARGHGDAELRQPARRRTAGRSLSMSAASPIPTRSPRRGREPLAERRRAARAASPISRRWPA